MKSSPTLNPGTLVNQYRILERAGAGGAGDVYLAHDIRLDRRVALKFLSCDLSRDPGHRARFERETRAVARIDHPNIVSVYDVGDHDGRPFLVMQYVQGPSVKGLPRGEDLPLERFLDLAPQICDGPRTSTP